ncbi:MAG: hypothetical protein R8G01_08870 [Ilumatobacteraceae bacterium]|nr:hypothetical protein [Ilumatobacteraceae bacterium]
MAKVRTLFISAVLLGVTACGSSDDNGASGESAANTDGSADSADTADAAPADEPATGSRTGTLTLDDGTAFTLEMTTCETSENGAAGFLIEDGFDLFGRTSDGEFTVQLIRAGFDEDSVIDTSVLEGEFDDEGKNAGLLYTEGSEVLVATVDGGNVSGTVTLKPIGPNRPYGDEIGATFDVDC